MPLFCYIFLNLKKKVLKWLKSAFIQISILQEILTQEKKNHFICKYFKSPQLINLRKRTVCILITRLLSLSKIHL